MYTCVRTTASEAGQRVHQNVILRYLEDRVTAVTTKDEIVQRFDSRGDTQDPRKAGVSSHDFNAKS